MCAQDPGARHRRARYGRVTWPLSAVALPAGLLAWVAAAGLPTLVRLLIGLVVGRVTIAAAHLLVRRRTAAAEARLRPVTESLAADVRRHLDGDGTGRRGEDHKP